MLTTFTPQSGDVIGTAQGREEALEKLCGCYSPAHPVRFVEWLNDCRSSKEALKMGPEHAIVTGIEFSNEALLDRLQFQDFEKVRNQRPQQ